MNVKQEQGWEHSIIIFELITHKKAEQAIKRTLEGVDASPPTPKPLTKTCFFAFDKTFT